jgi:predicted PurR-regulated permease PerM
MDKKSNRFFLYYVPMFIIFVIIFKFIYHDNGVSRIINIFVPILAGVFLSLVLNPLMNFLRRIFKVKLVAILLAYVIFVSVLTLFTLLIIPQIGRSLSTFIHDTPKIIAGIENLFRNPPEFLDFIETKEAYAFYQSNIPRLVESLTNFSSTMVSMTILSVISLTSALIKFVMALIISAYILWDKSHFERLYQKVLYSFFEKETSAQIIKLGNELNDNVVSFISGKLLDSFIIAIITYLGTRFIIEAQYPLILALIIGVTNMIPYFGPLIGGVPAIIITLLVDPVKGLWMILFVIIIQQFDGLILGPKILGIQLDLKPIWIIIAIIVGGGLFGIWGMFFATPVAALLKTIMYTYMEIKLRGSDLDFLHDD